MAVKPTTLLAAAVQQGLLDGATLDELARDARRERKDVVELACFRGRFLPAALYQALASARRLEYMAAGSFTTAAETAKKLSTSLLRSGRLLPVRRGEEELIVVSDPDDRGPIEAARRAAGSPLRVAVTDPETLGALARDFLQSEHPQDAPKVEGSPTDYVALLDRVLKRAHLARASDVHIEAQKRGYRIRYRVDGRLEDATLKVSREDGQGLLTRIKVLAGLDIAESREPQDGGLTYALDKERTIDIRVATLPTRHGERATMRLLGDDAGSLSLPELGFDEISLRRFRKTLALPHGIVLITGPTGSGKTTTLYAALGEIVAPDVNVLTVEDPVERPLAGVSQVQVDAKVGFAGALRSFLRHDPDVIMVGEIRDGETADVAFKAAVTGHLVFSTLHTNTAVTAITRLCNMGVPRYLVASSLAAVLAQRLVRRVCARCKQMRAATDDEAHSLGDGIEQVPEPVGCASCNGTGYRGRIALIETLWIDRDTADIIASSGSDAAIEGSVEGFRTLWQDAVGKVAGGYTTLSEIVRVVTPDKA